MVTRRNSGTNSDSSSRRRTSTRQPKRVTAPKPEEEPTLVKAEDSVQPEEPIVEPIVEPAPEAVDPEVPAEAAIQAEPISPPEEVSTPESVNPNVEEVTVEEPVLTPVLPSEEKPMSTPEVIDATAETKTGQGGAIAVRDQMSLSIWNRPVMPSDIEIVGTIQSSGIRPIEASHLAVFGTLLNNRPILASNLRVAEMLPGNRPIFFSDIQMVEGADLPGHRPILASDPGLMAASVLPGSRPIFSNDVDDAPVLMGYID